MRQVQNRNIAALNKLLESYLGETIIIGTHGTALSMIINYFDPGFGLEDFMRIKNVMPWVVKAVFDKNSLLEMSEIVLE